MLIRVSGRCEPASCLSAASSAPCWRHLRVSTPGRASPCPPRSRWQSLEWCWCIQAPSPGLGRAGKHGCAIQFHFRFHNPGSESADCLSSITQHKLRCQAGPGGQCPHSRSPAESTAQAPSPRRATPATAGPRAVSGSGPFDSPILQMRKLSLRAVRWLVKGPDSHLSLQDVAPNLETTLLPSSRPRPGEAGRLSPHE